MGFSLCVVLAILPPILCEGVKLAAYAVAFLPVIVLIIAGFFGIVFLVVNWRWASGWLWWGLQTFGVWTSYGARLLIYKVRVRQFVDWIRGKTVHLR